MAQHDFLKLASQGRAFDATRAWTEDELLSLEALIGTGLERTVAADYVRNGIDSVTLYEAAKAAGLEPKSLEAQRVDAVAAHQKAVREQLGTLEVSEPEVVPEPEAEEVNEPEKEVVEPEAEEVSEPEVVPEPEVIVEPEALSNKRGGKNK